MGLRFGEKALTLLTFTHASPRLSTVYSTAAVLELELSATQVLLKMLVRIQPAALVGEGRTGVSALSRHSHPCGAPDKGVSSPLVIADKNLAHAAMG